MFRIFLVIRFPEIKPVLARPSPSAQGSPMMRKLFSSRSLQNLPISGSRKKVSITGWYVTGPDIALPSTTPTLRMKPKWSRLGSNKSNFNLLFWQIRCNKGLHYMFSKRYPPPTPSSPPTISNWLWYSCMLLRYATHTSGRTVIWCLLSGPWRCLCPSIFQQTSKEFETQNNFPGSFARKVLSDARVFWGGAPKQKPWCL